MNIQRIKFGTFLDVREKAQDLFELINPLYSNIVMNDEIFECVIPSGFITDFCSVPRVPFAYTLFGGKYNKTGTLHDALYGDWREIQIVHISERYTIPITKKLADTILYRSLLDEGATRFTAYMMYQGVNIFGSAFFKRM